MRQGENKESPSAQPRADGRPKLGCGLVLQGMYNSRVKQAFMR
jgi:hypothetical protein